MSAWNTKIVRAGSVTAAPVGGVADGLDAAVLLSCADGSAHMEIALAQLAPGGTIAGHLHPFEESFYVFSGRGLLSVAGQSYELRAQDFGFAPVGRPHAWSNPFDEPLRWLRVRAPQPRAIGSTYATYPFADLAVPTRGREIDERNPSVRYVGHFSEADLPPPGPLSMPGYHGPNVQAVSIRMMVDDLLGAQHHTLFMVEFAGPTTPGLTAREHFHPFEEIYYYLDGRSTGWLGGERHDISAGDLVFMGVNVSHGFLNAGDGPMRWLEVQAPAPPPSDGFFFEDDWKRLDALDAAAGSATRGHRGVG